MENLLEKLKPGVPKTWLLLTAGLVWTGVGLYLIGLAVGWIQAPGVDRRWVYWFPGLILALIIWRLGFFRLADKNAGRILNINAERPCLFAFQEWHSYPLVLVMIGLGLALRKLTPIPKPLLGILYLGIGGGLAGASLRYYQVLLSRNADTIVK